MIPKIYTAEEIYSFFPHSLADMEKIAHDILNETTQSLEQLYQLSERTFENTVYTYDFLISKFNMISALFYAVEAVYPDETIRHAAHHNLLKLHSFGVDNFWQNEKLYAILKEFKEGNTYNKLTDNQKYFVEEHIKTYERNGVHLNSEVRARLKDIHKELGEHTLSFDRNIAADVRSIKVEQEDMKGLSNDFIAGLRREGDRYILAVDYPTYYEVMENCSVEKTRAALWHEFANRAYPANEEELAQIIALRDELAQLLGYPSFAHYDISSQMAKSSISVELFLEDLIQRSHAKVEKEIALLKDNLPQDVTLTPDGTYKPWDLMYSKATYKKQFLAVDESRIAEYFPLEHTLSSLLSIYEQFLGILFKKSHLNSIWHEHVEYITVYKEGKFIGSLLMDLFPRPGKYTHACHITLVPTCTRKGDFYPALSLVIANFPWPRAGHPALLPRQDVITFFHEFGHAVHALLGSSEFALCAGTSVKDDFVEMPSQMLEEWMWDPTILKRVSKHYKTGDSLPDDMIKHILSLRHFDSGYWLQRQAYFSLVSLYCFKEGAYKDIDIMHKQLFNRMFPYIQFTDDNHDYASFGHLTGYAAKYYGYLWSKVFALDMFDYIKQYGLLNYEIGKRYVDTILSKGGSEDPEKLLSTFLGRSPRIDAFIKILGL